MIWIKIGKRCALSFSKYSNNNSVGGCMCSWEEKHLQDGWKLDRHEKRMLRRERDTEPYQPNQIATTATCEWKKKLYKHENESHVFFSHSHSFWKFNVFNGFVLVLLLVLNLIKLHTRPSLFTLFAYKIYRITVVLHYFFRIFRSSYVAFFMDLMW